MARLPSSLEPLVTGQLVATPWFRFFQELAGMNPPGPSGVNFTASPGTYTASANGHVLVAGGAVSAISLVRGRATVATGMTSGFIPVSQGDKVVVTYTVLPTITFIPT